MRTSPPWGPLRRLRSTFRGRAFGLAWAVATSLGLLLFATSTGWTRDAAAAACPPEMALIEGRYCIDRYEAALQRRTTTGDWEPARRALPVGDRDVRAVPAAGIKPYGHVSAVGGAKACAAAGKRLCTSAEWLAACRGPDEQRWPYGEDYEPDACNDSYPGAHPVVDLFGSGEGVWDPEHMNDPALNRQPDTVDPGGSNQRCVSDYGVYDMHGNLHEWVADASGIFRGGFYGDARRNGAGCGYVTTAHGPRYRDYSTGFRCCSDPLQAPSAVSGASARSAAGR